MMKIVRPSEGKASQLNLVTKVVCSMSRDQQQLLTSGSVKTDLNWHDDTTLLESEDAD